MLGCNLFGNYRHELVQDSGKENAGKGVLAIRHCNRQVWACLEFCDFPGIRPMASTFASCNGVWSFGWNMIS